MADKRDFIADLVKFLNRCQASKNTCFEIHVKRKDFASIWMYELMGKKAKQNILCIGRREGVQLLFLFCYPVYGCKNHTSVHVFFPLVVLQLQ